MVLESEAEILALEGPTVDGDTDAQIDPAILELSPEDAVAVAEGQVRIEANIIFSISFSFIRVKLRR
jgi:hypothetical protein